MITSVATWTGMVPVDDTALAVTDTGGAGPCVVYLNGQFATQGYWRRVIAELGSGWRHITYDERARGRKSGRSADYSFEASVRDVDAVLDARGVGRALVVGWSYGAFVAAHCASRNPARAIGAVLVDGAQPHDWLTDEMEQGIRTAFRRLQWLMLPLRVTGLTPRMTAREMAECNIEVGRLARVRELGPVMDAITVPTRYVIRTASGSPSSPPAIILLFPGASWATWTGYAASESARPTSSSNGTPGSCSPHSCPLASIPSSLTSTAIWTRIRT